MHASHPPCCLACRLPASSAARKDGYAIHMYTASVGMEDSCLANADGDLLIVPQLVGSPLRSPCFNSPYCMVPFLPHMPGHGLRPSHWQ